MAASRRKHISAATDDPWLASAAAARHIGNTPATLAHWRLTGKGPPYSKGPSPQSQVKYRLSDLDAWLAARMRTSTSDKGAA